MIPSIVYRHEPSGEIFATPENRIDWSSGDLTPVAAENLLRGTKVHVGLGTSEVLADFDFETYSESGVQWVPGAGVSKLGAWKPLDGAGNKRSIFAVGGSPYAEHPTTEVISLAYNLKDGRGPRLWLPTLPPPVELFEFLAKGYLIEAHQCLFEAEIWEEVCVKQLGWPALNWWQLRDTIEKARAFALPGALAKSSDVLRLPVPKRPEGKRLIQKFSNPKNPSKHDPSLRNTVAEHREDARAIYLYNIDDIRSESELSARVPDLSPLEQDFALCTRAMNLRGVQIDREGVENCLAVLHQCYDKYNAELNTLTDGCVDAASKGAKLIEWLSALGVNTSSLDVEHVDALLAQTDLPPLARRALELRQLVSSAGVKKLFAMRNQLTKDGRLKQLFIYHGARTGRDTGADAQPQNLVKAGPDLAWCEEPTCKKPYYGPNWENCPWCGADEMFSKKTRWKHNATDDVLHVMSHRNREVVEQFFGDAVLSISGCIRGLFVAAPGKDLICSDFSSIEAVVAAMLSGEQWRIDAFHRHEDIYLASCAKITGRTLEWYMANGGKDHPDRQKLGKPAELGLGFGGWLGAWRQFGGPGTDAEAKRNILGWRAASPNIVETWGGQVRGRPWQPESFELFGLEGMAISALRNPGNWYTCGSQYAQVSYGYYDDVLYCRLPSGRMLSYHAPELWESDRWPGQVKITYEGYNTNPKTTLNGRAVGIGWRRMETYGGKLFENVVQAIARDLMAFSNIALERAGYPIVLRVHDELAAEVDKNFGGIEEFERIMSMPPEWASGWPIRASGGWRGYRFRKD